MSPLNLARVFSTLMLESVAAAYSDQDDRVLDQIERPKRGHKVATLAEVMARPVGLTRKAA